MSANNQLKIYRKTINGKRKWAIEHWDLDCGKHNDKFKECDILEDAAREANAFMKENEVEYGLNILTE